MTPRTSERPAASARRASGLACAYAISSARRPQQGIYSIRATRPAWTRPPATPRHRHCQRPRPAAVGRRRRRTRANPAAKPLGTRDASEDRRHALQKRARRTLSPRLAALDLDSTRGRRASSRASRAPCRPRERRGRARRRGDADATRSRRHVKVDHVADRGGTWPTSSSLLSVKHADRLAAAAVALEAPRQGRRCPVPRSRTAAARS